MARDTKRNYERALKPNTTVIRKTFLQAFLDIAASANIVGLTEAIAAGSLEAVAEALKLDPRYFAPLTSSIAKTFEAGGDYMVGTYPKFNPADNSRLIVRFDGRNRRAEEWIATKSGALITEILDDQRVMLSIVMENGVALGRNPKRVALDIVGRIDAVTKRRKGGLIGLTSKEADYVSSMRSFLSSPDTADAYFTRAARDKRFDALVRRGIENGKTLSETQINKISGRYSDRLLLRRGERIARTEAIAAMNAGRQEAMFQLIDSGLADVGTTTKKWSATMDNRTRHDHRLMHLQVVKVDEPFISPSGSRLMHPADSSLGAHGKDVIHCRCYMSYVIDWLARAA